MQKDQKEHKIQFKKSNDQLDKPDFPKKQKPSKQKSELVELKEQNVFNLIHSINQSVQQYEKKHKAIVMEIMNIQIKNISFSQINDLRMHVKNSLSKIYYNSQIKTQQIQQKKEQQKISYEHIIELSIIGYLRLVQALKQICVVSPIQEAFFEEFLTLWKSIFNNITQQQTKQNIRQKMLDLWRVIPNQMLQKHLMQFQLLNQYQNLDEERMSKQLISLLVDNRIQQCCTYYELYRRNISLKEGKVSPLLRQFQDQSLIPKISKSDHIFSTHVSNLLKSNEHIKTRMLNSNQLDPAVGLKVVDLLKEDGRQYYNIYMYVLKQHYKSVIFDQKDWYSVQDKLSFNKNFIEWYTEDIQKAFNHQQKASDSLLKIKKELKHIDNIQNVRCSILKRNGTLSKNHAQFQYIQNPLFQFDRFDCSELIIAEIQSKQSKKQFIKLDKNYIRFQQYGIKQSDVVWIDEIDQLFFEMKKNMLNSSHVGFDTQFRCISTKYEQQGVSIIQLSTHKHHYIIDFLKLQKQNQFFDFFVQFLTSQNIFKIGHTLSSDMKYLKYTFHIPEEKGIKSFIDIANEFKNVNPGQKFSSLAFLCERYLLKSLAKYQQRSNWNRRPLKKAQIHYAALDAYSCLLIYQKIEKQKSTIIQQHVKHGRHPHQFHHSHPIQKKNLISQKKSLQKAILQEQSDIVFYDEQQQNQQAQIQGQMQQSEEFYLHGDTYRSNTFIYNKKFEQMLKDNKQPKFLVDNMLKKLSSIMRNCGLDAQYISIRDYSLASDLAEKENRIILTRDLKFFQRKQHKVPIYLLKERGDCDKMFDQIVAYFKINLGNFQTLSRCVKCNGPELSVITRQQALKQIQFKYEDSPIFQFWRCTKCKQIYWQGGQFKNAKQKYGKLKNQKF